MKALTTGTEVPMLARAKAQGTQCHAFALVWAGTDHRAARSRYGYNTCAFTPTEYDEFVRSDGLCWMVRGVTGGPGHVFWRPYCRQGGA